MAVPTNTIQNYAVTGMREDLEDVITQISPTETPLLTMIGRVTAKARKHEWQMDELSDATSGNAVLEGDTPSADALKATVRMGNYCQLMDKVVSVSSTMKAIDEAGRADEMAYQMAKRGLELRRDLDASISRDGAATAGAAATASLMAGLESWLVYHATHTSTLQDGAGTCVGGNSAGTVTGFVTATGYINVAKVDSTSCGTLTESILRNVLTRACDFGADVKYLMTSPRVKSLISKNFAGIATRYREVPRGQAAIVGGADLYISDFGELQLTYSRQMRNNVGSQATGAAIFGIDPSTLAVAYLQPFNEIPLAKVGHSDQRMLSVEATLVVKNPQACFQIGDVFACTAG